MFKKVLLQMQQKVRNRDYVMTAHARKEMNEIDIQGSANEPFAVHMHRR